MKTKTYTKHKKNTKNDEWTATGSMSSKRTNKKPESKPTCMRCKDCKDGCEFYDRGFCRGVCYTTYPPKWGKCVFDVSGNDTKQYFTDEEIDKILGRKESQLDRIERKLDELLKRQQTINITQPETWTMPCPYPTIVPEQPTRTPVDPYGNPTIYCSSNGGTR